MFNKPTYKQLQDELKQTEETANFFADKFHENEHLLEVATEAKNFYREMMEQLRERTERLEEKTDDRFYFRMKKSDYNQLINEKVILYNENQELIEEIKRMKENAGKIDINLNAQPFDVNELAKKISEEMIKGRY